ncbi:S8 family serine peptidase [Streptomyces sp. 4N509B]|uniref:S8 family serine peptidase n=1 Tax=Streptomyces sp. 4N509B TaxID=3457413 RepID=UPI003FD3C266
MSRFHVEHGSGKGTTTAVAVRVACAGLAGALGVATLLTTATPAVAATAMPCRNQMVDGEELPEGAETHPLVDSLALRHAWDMATGGGVTVAVVDSGVDADHPELADAVVDGSEFVGVQAPREFDESRTRPTTDCAGHGTAVAGVIAADRRDDRVVGVAPDATVYPVRVVGNIGHASNELLAAAIDDAVDSGAGVINLSFGRSVDDELIREAVERALSRDVVVVAAAGNDGIPADSDTRVYPAAYDGVLAVGAVGADHAPLDGSNAGPWVDLVGFGDADLTVVAPDDSGYRQEGGTSIAAAQVSGAAALVRSRFPELPAAEVARRLTDSATPLGGGRNDRTGAGLVDPYSALTHLGDHGGGNGGEEGRGDGSGAGAGRIPVRALPAPEPPLGTTATTALAWSGGLLLAVVLVLLAAPAVRRAARRGWRPGAVALPASATAPAPASPEPDGPHNAHDAHDPPPPRVAAPRPTGRLAWLAGAPTATPDTPHRNRDRNRSRTP